MMSAWIMIGLLLPSYNDVMQQEQTLTCHQEAKASMSLELGGEDGAVLKLSGLEHPQHLKRWIAQDEPDHSLVAFTLYEQLLGAPMTTQQDLKRPKNSALRPVVASAVIAGAVALMLELSLGSSCEQPESPQSLTLAPPVEVEPAEGCLICEVDPSWFDAQDPVTANPWQQRMAQQEVYYNQAQASQPGAGFGPQGTGVIGADQTSRHVVRSSASAGAGLDRASAPSPSVRPIQGPSRNSTWRAR